ncbi:MAG: NfeD family protein [Candidatus Limnocylindrales bacterium]
MELVIKREWNQKADERRQRTPAQPDIHSSRHQGKRDGSQCRIGQVQANLAPVGTVYVGRESWTAKTEDGTSLDRDTKVRVIRQEGLTLIVKKVE